MWTNEGNDQAFRCRVDACADEALFSPPSKMRKSPQHRRSNQRTWQNGRLSLDSGVSFGSFRSSGVATSCNDSQFLDDSLLSQSTDYLSNSSVLDSSFDPSATSMSTWHDIESTEATAAKAKRTSGAASVSPPTKWPRVTTTPPSRRGSVGVEDGKSSEAPNLISLFSPPHRARNSSISHCNTPSSSSSLRTPTTIRRPAYASPSPFRSLSKFRTATVSTTKLQLSNSENATGYRICGGSELKKIERTQVNRSITASASKRCLVPTRTNSQQIIATTSVKPCEKTSECSTTTSISEGRMAPETPSKHLTSEMSMFEGFDTLPNTTPTKFHDVFGDEFDNCDLIGQSAIDFEESCGPAGMGILKKDSGRARTISNKTRKVFVKSPRKREEECVRDLMFTCGVRINRPIDGVVDEDIQLIGSTSDADCSKIDSSIEAVANVDVREKLFPSEISNQIGDMGRKKYDETEVISEDTTSADDESIKEVMEEPFVTPTKKIDLFSARWTVIATGQTLAQRQLTAAAEKLLRSKGLKSKIRATNKESDVKKRSAISRVILFRNRLRS